MSYTRPRKAHKGLAVRRGVSGLGLFTTAPIPRRTFVIEYWGKVISEEEADRRGGKYLFGLDNEDRIDGTTRKNIARYVNHSCKPNCEPKETIKGRIFIKSLRVISPGEELTYDYGREYWNDIIKPHGCRCGHHRTKQK